MKSTGGYLTNTMPLVRANLHSHTGQLDQPVSDADLKALNAVQDTPWRINTFILDVMMRAWLENIRLPGVSKAITKDVPERMDDAIWKAMPVEDRKAHLKVRGELHSFNASANGRERALLDYLGVADEMRDQPSIYFPHNRCFRGRMHPMITCGPHPQANDMGKSLLMFASGLPLGPEGLYWLLVRAANCAGQDKLPLDERVMWAIDHKEDIRAAAADPFASHWWRNEDVDEPWGLLATAHELRMAWSLPTPADFVSHLPVPLDGTCNGLQHLSAMGLDPVGARATNLTSTGPRQDIYLEVAAVVRQLVEKDILEGHPVASVWLGKLDGAKGRKLVKRAVMTTPYGVTDRGIRDQIINDGHVKDIDGVSGEAADYIRDKIVEALGTSVGSARAIMAWLQTAAERLGKAGLPFDWTTPTGSKVRQAYHLTVDNRVKTLCGQVRLVHEDQEIGLNPRKQALGAAPNYIHSFDASHLSLTVQRAHDEGIRSFAMIHDSYGTHARNTGQLSRVLREAFVAIYSTDQLARTAAEITLAAPHVELPPLPARGTFNIREVLFAPFFFS